VIKNKKFLEEEGTEYQEIHFVTDTSDVDSQELNSVIVVPPSVHREKV
jgi:hypothetical protein